ncbi:MAG: hypothetical protein ACFE0I_12790 [Elainellaceae cyanobacterium]
MTIDDFIQRSDCSASFSPALQALWHDKQGDWHRAHAIVQEEGDRDSAWVHAYLHRKEGDLSNAGYWYRRAQKPASRESLAYEWEQIAQTLLMSHSKV